MLIENDVVNKTVLKIMHTYISSVEIALHIDDYQLLLNVAFISQNVLNISVIKTESGDITWKSQ